jgi:Uma2 family endonuclease
MDATVRGVADTNPSGTLAFLLQTMASSSGRFERGECAMQKLTVYEYLRLPETMRPMELVYGVVREPPAPRYGHQSLLTRLTAMLAGHVAAYDLGEVCVAPVDVVLDEALALVVQPDIVFVARERLHIVRDRIWGPPDLVVEVLSPRTARRDRTTKLGWYRQYGVGECWLADTKSRCIEVVDLRADPEPCTRGFSGDSPLVSGVLTRWTHPAAAAFA